MRACVRACQCVRASACMCLWPVPLCVWRYLAGADGAGVVAGLPVLPVAPDPALVGAVATAAGPGGAHTVVAPREVHAHAVVPAGVRLQAALVHV
jgi:hypothetical protein